MENNKLEILYRVMFADLPDIVTIKQLQQMLGISRHLAYRLVESNDIFALKVGNSFKVPKVSVIDYIVANRITFGKNKEE